MECRLLVNTWIDKDNKLRGKKDYPCGKEASKKIIYTLGNNFTLNACSYHAKIEKNRGDKYKLGIVIKDISQKDL
jgi:hypothetical protein